MDNLMPTISEAATNLSQSISKPFFELSEDEAIALYEAARQAGIKGRLMEKIRTVLHWARARAMYGMKPTKVILD